MNSLLIGLLISAFALAQPKGDLSANACVRFLTGGTSDGSTESFQDQTIKIEKQIRDLKDLNRTANELDRQADKIAESRKGGLSEQVQLTEAENNARYGEKSTRLNYCRKCHQIKDQLDQLETRLHGMCPPKHVKDLQVMIDQPRKNWREACAEKEPYKELCKKK